MFQQLQSLKQSEPFKVNLGIVITILILSIWLYFDFNANLQGGGKVIGKVIYKVKEVDRKFGSQIIWKDVDVDSNIYNYDTIRTDNFSRVKVVLNDKTEIELDSNSMVVFDLSSENLNVDFLQGKMQLNNVNTKGDKNIKITSGDSEVKVDSSEVKLNKTSDSNLDVDVVKGKAEIKKGDSVQNLQKDDQVRIRGEKIRKDKKIFRLLSPINSKYFLTQNQLEEINFSWESDDNSKDYSILEIYNVSDKYKKVFSKKLKGNKYQVKLKPAKYKWKILDDENGHFESDSFYVVNENPVDLYTPEDKSVFYYLTKPPRILVSWSRNEFVNSYKLEISNTSNFDTIIHKLLTENETTVVDSLEEGKYYYRVITKTGFPDSAQKISSIKSFTINKNALPNPPSLITPSENYIFKPQNKFIFAWNPLSDYSKYQLQIATDKKFRATVHSSETVERSMSLPSSLPENKYYWKVKGKLGESDKWIESAIRTFEVKKEEVPKILTIHFPENNSSVDVIDMSNFIFKWEKIPNAVYYNFELKRLPEGKTVIKQAKVTKNQFVIDDLKILKTGNYLCVVQAKVSQINSESITTNSAANKFRIYLSRRAKKDDIEFVTPEDVFIE
ncbi:MAG: FecR domain-containing protein [Leptospiraceae bacterium]|nr:FecR domain-containing protein [Leptospiraceae bacterium]MCP5493752.1 FecR domain-containing protein [Leptospiraceae bacterium]